MQRRLGIIYSASAVFIGALLSALVAPPALVIASGVAFLLSELADLAVYTPLARRGLVVDNVPIRDAGCDDPDEEVGGDVERLVLRNGALLTMDPALVAIESRFVIEVLPLVPHRPLPLLPEYVSGMFVYRGRLVPVVDLGMRLRIHPRA